MDKKELREIIKQEIRLTEGGMTPEDFKTKGLDWWVKSAIEKVQKGMEDLDETASASKNRDFKKFIGQLDKVVDGLSDYMDKNYGKWGV